MTNHEFFDRFEALTFDDVVVVPGYSEVLPDAVDTSATFAGRSSKVPDSTVGCRSSIPGS